MAAVPFFKRILVLKMSKKAKNVLLVIFIFSFFLLIYLFWVRRDMSDFSVSYQGGKRIIDGETLYRPSDDHLQYKYSPGSAVFFSLFALLPYEAAKFIWYLLELFLLFIILVLSYDILPAKQMKKGLVIVLSFLVLLKFLAREIELGQVNIFIVFLLATMLIALLKKNDVAAGLIWGFSLLFKPYALVFLPYFILKKRIKLMATGFGMTVIGLIFPAIFYGFKGNITVLREWQQTMVQSTGSLLDSYDNASLHAFFLKILPTGNRDLVWILIIFFVLLIGFSFLGMMLRGKRENLKQPEVLEFSFLFILIPLLSPLGWNYNYLYSFLAVIFLLNFIGIFPPFMRYGMIINFIIIGASLMEVMGKEIFRFYTHYALVAVNYLIVLFYLFYLRMRNYA